METVSRDQRRRLNRLEGALADVNVGFAPPILPAGRITVIHVRYRRVSADGVTPPRPSVDDEIGIAKLSLAPSSGAAPAPLTLTRDPAELEAVFLERIRDAASELAQDVPAHVVTYAARPPITRLYLPDNGRGDAGPI